MENSALVVTAQGEVRGARADDAQVIGDEQFAGGDRDGAGNGESDRVAWRGALNRLPQRAGAAVVGAGDSERRGRDRRANGKAATECNVDS